MGISATETQAESRTKTAGIPCTATEKGAVEGLSRLRNTSEADLLRAMLIGDIVKEFERVQSLMDSTDAAASQATPTCTPPRGLTWEQT